MSGTFKPIALPLIFGLMWSGVALSQDITKFNILETHAPATINAIKISNQNFAFRKFELQKYGGLQWPIISFNISNKGRVTIKRIYLRAVLKAPGRSVPFADHDIDYAIPGGLAPGQSSSASPSMPTPLAIGVPSMKAIGPQGGFRSNSYSGRRRRRKQAR